MTGIASLRCGDPNVRMAIAAGGGPMYADDHLHISCVLCTCGMSQDAFEPNPRCEWCEDPACLCHREDLP